MRAIDSREDFNGFQKKNLENPLSDGRKKMISKNLENFENLEKSRKYFRTFSIENHIENKKNRKF